MTERDDFEKRLQRYRPSPPPPGLRARVLTPSRSAGWLAWIPAAAAAVAIVVLHSWTSATYSAVVTEVEQPKLAAQAAALDDITRILGDDEQVKAEAERLMNVQHDVIPGDADGQTVGGSR